MVEFNIMDFMKMNTPEGYSAKEVQEFYDHKENKKRILRVQKNARDAIKKLKIVISELDKLK